ncbi:MAG: dihydrolipoyl dehydrogenase [Candidatus Marsarchaeota archaeon]|jgi:dihydrolipoamide dehydrogenase|nr:dihydrolipoyl dehydrogenase [Candidatus Marsarchaeota archaeon]MCL5111963.1 dihydrolipoyl dehydrogenase [Candidatus Marsarchaeota archaeon]
MVMGSLPEQVDVAVIGGGVGGYVAAIRAAQLGKSVALVEKEKLGGHCLNYACIPSKTLIHISDIFYQAQHSQKFGINVQGASIDAKKMLDWRMSVSKKLEDGVAFLCKSNGIDVLKGTGTFLSSSSIQLTDGVTLEFKKAIIATGSNPTALKGFEFGDGIIDYKQALMLDHIPKTMLIIGAGYVAVEIGTLYAKLGTQVTVLARSDVLSHFDRDAVELVKGRMVELGVKIATGVTPTSRNGSAVSLSDGSKVDAETIVVATGLSPYTKELGLENTKVKLDDKGFITVDKALQTSDPNILAVGDVIGEPLLAHKAIRQGVIAGEVAAGQHSAYENLVVPAVIFSDPEIAIAGSVEESEGIKVTKFPLTALGRSIALGSTNGFVKIAYEDDGLVKGVEIVSPDANSMIAEAALAIEMGATIEDIADTIHPHPTYSEAIQEAAEAALGRPVHFFYGKPSG